MSRLSSPLHASPGRTDTAVQRGFPPDPSGGKRFHTLDALRGVAAINVVLLHFYDMWAPEDMHSVPMLWRSVIVLMSPIYAGHSAVILFFVLSGFVLALPCLREAPCYSRFLLRRAIRIYIPYWFALAIAIFAAHHFYPHAGHGYRVAGAWALPLDWKLIAQHVLLIGSFNSREYDLVVWSLVHEMRISIIFPFLCAGVIRFGWKRSMSLAVLGAMLESLLSNRISAYWAQYISTVHYLPLFILGICMAANMRNLERWWHGTSHAVRRVLFVTAVGLYGYVQAVMSLCRLLLHHVGLRLGIDEAGYWFITDLTTAAGACGLLIAAILYKPTKALLETSGTKFLGKISYSLYLIHVIVLFSLSFSVFGKLKLIAEFFLYVLGAILSGWLMWRMVEQPSIALSRQIR